MKFLTRPLSLVTVASLALFFANCGGDGGGGSAKEKTQLKKLSGTWEILSADLQGDDRIDDFTGFTLTISGTYDSDSPEGPYQYSVSGSKPTPSPWPASGNWSFSTAGKDQGLILRDAGTDDETPMSYKILSNGNLVLTISVPDGSEGWRTKEVSGDWTFTFTQ
ncbi:MAG: hypothetical protein E6Q96_07460 [Cyclobacteriaceae bacterium]|nr:MAG: hypothetical protein E6Q96_07460 [Cyclobacteriaceae bacterium]